MIFEVILLIIFQIGCFLTSARADELVCKCGIPNKDHILLAVYCLIMVILSALSGAVAVFIGYDLVN